MDRSRKRYHFKRAILPFNPLLPPTRKSPEQISTSEPSQKKNTIKEIEGLSETHHIDSSLFSVGAHIGLKIEGLRVKGVKYGITLVMKRREPSSHVFFFSPLLAGYKTHYWQVLLEPVSYREGTHYIIPQREAPYTT